MNLRPKRAARTRTRKRVGIGRPSVTEKNGSSLLGIFTRIRDVDELPALTNTATAPSRLKTTVLRPLPRRKLRPRMISVWPTFAFSGEIAWMTGVGFGRLTAAGAAGANASSGQ